MEMNSTQPKYWAISLGVVLVAAFVLVQPTLQTANAVGVEGLPAYDNCDWLTENNIDLDDQVSMTSVKNKEIVKTVHAEKELFNCFLDQGNLPVFLDLTTYIEVYENITSKEVIKATAFSTKCLFDGEFEHNHSNAFTATLIDCATEEIPSTPAFVGANCHTHELSDPQEQNMVVKGKIAKTIESQKFIWGCQLDDGTRKKVDLVVFTDIYEDLNTQERTDVQFFQMRCVVVINDEQGSDEFTDGTVESCIFDEVED
jgi:hypothetical protein